MLSARDELSAAWAEWGRADLYARWRRSNPGEAAKLDAYRAGGPRPSLATPTGRALVAETAAWLSLAPAPPPPPSSPSGEPMPVGDLPGWRQVFADDFEVDVPLGSFLGGKHGRWNPYPYPWKDTSGHGTYWPERGLSVRDGVLDVWLHTETVDGRAVHVVNAPQPILPGAARGQLYGRYAIRFRADPVPGYKTAWLLWPDSGLRTDGEIDFPEGNLDSTIHAFMHRQDAASGSDQDAYSSGVGYSTWHTAVIEWLPSRCTFVLDGKVIGNSTSRIPATPMHYVIQTETVLGGAVPSDAAEGHVEVDWVAIYAPAAG